jgi:uncharacterized membrane protein
MGTIDEVEFCPAWGHLCMAHEAAAVAESLLAAGYICCNAKGFMLGLLFHYLFASFLTCSRMQEKTTRKTLNFLLLVLL